MYLNYWGLHTPPFLNTPNRDVFFHSPQHEEAIHRLLYIVQHRKGIAMLTGEVGCGKTTLVRALTNYLSQNKYDILTISNPAVNPNDLIRDVLLKLGDNGKGESKTLLLDRLRRFLEMHAEQGIETILVIDEAHMIRDNSTLDELRMMLNIQTEDQVLMTMILLGQPPLLEKISQLHPLKERINMRIHIKPLDYINTGKYILYRLKQAGAGNGIFSRESIGTIYQASEGLPLRINNICDRSLLIGLMHKSRMVTVKMVEEALADLE